MRNGIMAIILSTLTFVPGTGQELKHLTLEDVIPGGKNWYNYYPSDLDGLQWWGDKVVSPQGEDSLITIHAENGKEKFLFTFDQLNACLTQKGLHKVYRPDRLFFPEEKKENVYVHIPGQGYALIDFKKWELIHYTPIPPEGKNLDLAPKTGATAYTKENNLFIATPQGERKITDEKEGIISGQSVHRDEFGIRKGTFWSPDAGKLAFYRMDESMVTQYPLVNIGARCAQTVPIRYPMAGMTSHKVTIGIYDLSDEKTIYLQTGDPTDRYFTNIAWSPDSKKIYIIELNRDQNHAELVRYDATTGTREKVLYEEHHPKYVHPVNPILFLPWDSDQFLLQSERDGYNHLYLYQTDGTLVKQLTQGPWIVQKVLGFDPSKKEIIISSNELSPLQSNVFRIHIPDGKRTFMGMKKEGWQTAQLSPSGQFIINSYDAHDVPRKIDIIDGYKQKSIHLLTAENPYKGYQMPSIEIGTLKAADDSTELYYRLVKPSHFNPNKKYPVIIYVYAGPGVRLITDNWLYATRGWDLYMADQGYLVFSLDSRGSSERGFEFESSTFRRLGIEEGKDQMRGVSFLKSLPYVDGERIGVHGWSFGGYMTISLMLRHPDTFKVGVAGGSVIDWKYYEIMYGERYMDTPESNPEGYEECDLTRLAGELKGHLLLIQDDNDPVVVPQHTLSFLKACVDARTYPDFFMYPGHAHNVLGRDRVHLYEKVTRYFNEYLKQDK